MLPNQCTIPDIVTKSHLSTGITRYNCSPSTIYTTFFYVIKRRIFTHNTTHKYELMHRCEYSTEIIARGA